MADNPIYQGLDQLGQQTHQPQNPEDAQLERVPNPHAGTLYLTRFRNHGAFHEDCTVSIGKKIFDFTEATWLRISGYWYPRGGIPIDVFWQSGEVPAGLHVPETGVASYRGRG